MSFEVDIDHERGLVASVWRGIIDEAECVAYIEGVWSDTAVAAYDELVDFREVTDFRLGPDAITRLVSRSRSVADPQACARSVMVASEAVVFGLSRMYVSMRDVDDEHQREWQVLTDYKEALSWLGESSTRRR